jgi:HEAT repeat protein
MPCEIWQLEDYVRFSESPDVRVRSWAFERLRDLYGNEAMAPIARLLHDADEFIACMAPAFLAEQGAVEYTPAILKRFREARAEGPVANACALALGKLGYEKAVPALAGRLESCEPLAGRRPGPASARQADAGGEPQRLGGGRRAPGRPEARRP